MFEAIIGGGIALFVATVGAAYKVGSDRGKRNGNFVTEQSCVQRQEILSLRMCRKLDRVMAHLGVEDGDDNNISV